MSAKNFAIAFSEKNREEAAKEVSLKIKLSFPKQINHLLIFFTPHYRPQNILKTVNLTLKPKTVYGMQAPYLIFENAVVQKGIVACCINKEGVQLKEFFSRDGQTQKIEAGLNSLFRKLDRKNLYLLSFISPRVNPYSCLSAAKLSTGRFFDFLGAGYIKKYSSYNSQIINNGADEGLLNIAVNGLKVRSFKVGGYTILGKPFVITKASPLGDVIIEINSEPAINIYKHYLEDKFETFLKNRLFSFYPLGVKTSRGIQIINIIDCLEDGSLTCIGEAREKKTGHIMFLDSDSMLKNLNDNLASLKDEDESLAFIVNSLSRKKTSKEASDNELKTIKQILGDKVKIIGLYSDYAFFSDKEKGRLNLEAGNLLLNLWQ